MKIDIIEPISLCSGVEKSIKQIKNASIQFKGKKIFCIGQPIHNEEINKEIEQLGICLIDCTPDKYKEEIEKLPDNCVVIFSAHGHDKKLDKICENKSMIIVDTICPIVAKIENYISDVLKNNTYDAVYYIGKKNHAESYSALQISDKVVFWDIISSFLVDIQYKNSIILNQTTILKSKLQPIYDQALALNPNIVIKNTSCPSVELRYNKLFDIDKKAYDYIAIIGSKNSSNTVELYTKALSLFPKDKVLFISSVEDAKALKLNYDSRVALFSGTSAPRKLIEEIKNTLMQG